MLSAFTFSLAVGFLSIFNSVYTANQNETTQIKNDNDFADSSDSLAGNITANFSVSDSDLDEKVLDFGSQKLNANFSVMDRSGEQELLLPIDDEKHENTIEFNIPKNGTVGPKKLEEFRPSPQLETFYEYNKFPVKPALPEAKIVRNYASVVSEVERLPLENDRQTSRNLNNFAPGYSAYGSGNFQNPERNQNGVLSKNTGIPDSNGPPWITRQGANDVNRNTENGDAPWVSRVRFPQNPVPNESPYSFIPNTGTGQNTNVNSGLSSPNNNEYLPPSAGTNNYYPSPTNQNQGTPKTNPNNLNTNKAGYLPPSPSYGYAGGGNTGIKNRYSSHSNYGSSGANEEFNFNKLVEVPKTYYSEAPNKYSSHHNTYETSYNLMENPSPEDHHKTYGGGMSHPWKKILKLFATFIPIGLLISALTPTVITVTNVNDTGPGMDNTMPATRYRSTNNPKKELTDHILSSLDYFDKLNENGCEYRVFCELLVNAGHMPNSKQHVDNLLDNFASQEINYKDRAEDLKKVFAAVKSHDCTSIPCEYIKNPT